MLPKTAECYRKLPNATDKHTTSGRANAAECYLPDARRSARLLWRGRPQRVAEVRAAAIELELRQGLRVVPRLAALQRESGEDVDVHRGLGPGPGRAQDLSWPERTHDVIHALVELVPRDRLVVLVGSRHVQ